MSGYSRLVTYTVGGALLSVAVFFFLVKPALNRVSFLTQEERTTKAEVNRLEQQIKAYMTAQADLAKATNKDLLFSTIVDDKKLYIPIEEMEAAAQRTGTSYELKILRDSLDEVIVDRKAIREEAAKRVTSQTMLEEVPYTLVVYNQSYANLVTFFRLLEHIPHFTEITGIQMSLQTVEGSQREAIAATINGVFLAKKNEHKAQE